METQGEKEVISPAEALGTWEAVVQMAVEGDHGNGKVGKEGWDPIDSASQLSGIS